MHGEFQTGDEFLAALAHRCAAGDRAALRAVYDLQAPRLKGLALRMTGSALAAEDIVHDVFVRFWQDAALFDPSRGTLRAWLTTMTRSRALDLLRRRGREAPEAERQEWPDDSPDALDRLAARAEGRALRACLAALDAAPRRMIVLAFVEGHTHAELAETLGMPLGTVKSTIRRGLAALRRCLAPQDIVP